jgi:hypothetical protein
LTFWWAEAGTAYLVIPTEFGAIADPGVRKSGHQPEQ